LDVSLRPSRIEGDCDDDAAPVSGDTVQAYVIQTSKSGCFLRINRQVEGRAILKELSDGFLPNPSASFPPGRLVVGKVKEIRKANKVATCCQFVADIDMRGSELVDGSEKKVSFEDIEVGGKYKGTVTRIEDYGVFVRVENSEIGGLVHKSECSDLFIKSLDRMYDPGDLVKLLVLKKNKDKKQLGFSMKASHFEDDVDSGEDSVVSDEDAEGIVNRVDEDIDSEDENFGGKLAFQVEKHLDHEHDERGDASSSDDDDSVSTSKSASSDNASSGSESDGSPNRVLDTTVGFDWNDSKATHEAKESSDDESVSNDGDDTGDGAKQPTHKSRKQQVQRRREEQEIARRETALADGTADDNPETADDYERMLTGDPNSSELWIRYMAFHVTLANVQAAREVANRAFSRIEFREEKEKLNVWSALLTMELKFGSEASLQDALDRACQTNNPKYVYLRFCEMMENQATGGSLESIQKADEAYAKMCKKFKTKKKVWIRHMMYLLKYGRHEEAQDLSKRALLSLKPYKHVETMSKFAQLVLEYGSAEKARTIFDGLLAKYPKRLDLLFVYADKETKHGEASVVRSLFSRVAKGIDDTFKMNLSDKQMKKLFKKWFSFEEEHGTESTQQQVKDAAREFVEKSSK
jgi:rRNA biogenesis protein RRP5